MTTAAAEAAGPPVRGLMISYRSLVVALVLPLSFARCASRSAAPFRPGDDRDVIKQLRSAQNVAIARQDYSAVAERWTDDITVRAGLGKALSGRQAYHDAFVADSAMTYTRTPDDVVMSSTWPLAYERGHWRGVVRRAPDATLSGEYSAQWVKRGETWLIRSELFVATSCTGQACRWPASVP